MNKRILSLMLALSMAFSIGVCAEPEQNGEEPLLISPKNVDIKLTIGENIMIVEGDTEIPLDVPPTIINDRAMVPLRAIFNALGASVSWDGETKTIFAIKEDTVIAMQIGQAVIYVNGDVREIDSPSVIVEDRTLVPVRAIAEAFGNKVNYDGETRTVTITN